MRWKRGTEGGADKDKGYGRGRQSVIRCPLENCCEEGSPKLAQLDQESKSSYSIVECNLTDATLTIWFRSRRSSFRKIQCFGPFIYNVLKWEVCKGGNC